jgi:ribonuclease HI
MAKKNFYAVARGKVRGVYTTWAECSAQVTGVNGAKFKGFATKAEADQFMGEPVGSTSFVGGAAPQPGGQAAVKPSPKKPSAAKKAARAPAAADPADEHRIRVYTDGSCRGNHSVQTSKNPAGWGFAAVNGNTPIQEMWGPVVIDPGDCAYLGAEHGSNNTGELCAITEALLWLRDFEDTGRAAVICYDSEYAHKMTTGEWRPKENIKLVQHNQV